MASKLFTFGYEGLSIDPFIERLLMNGVRLVVDVRELPLSRKSGFSKSAFTEKLRLSGIDYAHIAKLGCPKFIRNEYKQDGDWLKYAKSFKSYLGQQSETVIELAKAARKTTACLVCFEADFNRCHRSFVARATALSGGPRVVHLTAREAIPDGPDQAAA